MKPNLKKSRMHKIVSEMVFVDTEGNPVGDQRLNVKRIAQNVAGAGGKHSEMKTTKKAVIQMQRKTSDINLSDKPVSITDTEQQFRRHLTGLLRTQARKQNTLAINYPMLVPLTTTDRPSSEGAPKVRRGTTRIGSGFRPGEAGPKPGTGRQAGRQPRRR